MLPRALAFGLVLAAGAPAPVAAQADTLRLSLEQAIELARTQNPAFLAALNDQENADWEVREPYGQLLPSASARGALSWQRSGEQRFGSLTLAQDQPVYHR